MAANENAKLMLPIMTREQTVPPRSSGVPQEVYVGTKVGECMHGISVACVDCSENEEINELINVGNKDLATKSRDVTDAPTTVPL